LACLNETASRITRKNKFNQFLVLPDFYHWVPHGQTLWIDELAVGRRQLGGKPNSVAGDIRTTERR
jgi:hypothetical protein